MQQLARDTSALAWHHQLTLLLAGWCWQVRTGGTFQVWQWLSSKSSILGFGCQYVLHYAGHTDVRICLSTPCFQPYTV